MLWSGQEPLLVVRHHDDGDWTFSGATEAADDNADEILLYVHLGHVVERFPAVESLAALPRDRSATRTSEYEAFVEAE